MIIYSSSSNYSLMAGALKYIYVRIRGNRLVWMILAVLLMFLVGWLTNYPAILLGEILNTSTSNNVSFSTLYEYIALVGILLILREAAVIGRKYIVEKLATQLEKEEFISVISHILNVEIKELYKNQVGAINVKINRSIDGVIRLIKLCFMDFLPSVIIAGTAMFFAALFHWSILFIMLVVLIFGAIVTWWQVTSQKGIRIELFRAKESIGAKLAELVLGIEYVRTASGQSIELKRSSDIAFNLQRKEFLHHKWMMFFDSLKMLVEGAGFILVISAGFLLLDKGEISAGDILTFSVLYIAAATPLRELHRIVDEGFEAALMIDDLKAIYSLKTDPLLLGNQSMLLEDKPFFECDNLSVRIKTKEEERVILDKISLRIDAGTRVGFAGESGSGKSTLLRVILGIQDYTGNARIYGIEIKEIDKKLLSKMLCYVPQSPFIFKGSVLDNITYPSLEDAPDLKKIESAIKLSNSGFINSELGGVESVLEEHGRNLSGGERQRLAIARALYANTPAIFLDEATSALDSETKARVENSLKQLTPIKTQIIIAHRLSSLENTDCIYCLKNGTIIQQGKYDELSANEGYFHDLITAESFISNG